MGKTRFHPLASSDGRLPRDGPAAHDTPSRTPPETLRRTLTPPTRANGTVPATILAQRVLAAPRQIAERERAEAIHGSARLADQKGVAERVGGGAASTVQRVPVLQRVPPYRNGDIVMVELEGTTYHGEVVDLDTDSREYLVKLHFRGTGGGIATLAYDDQDVLTEASKPTRPVRVVRYQKTKGDAQAELAKAQRSVYRLIQAGAKTEPASPRDLLWRNSCEWLLSGTGVKLTIVVPTHDMLTRAGDWRKAPTYFDFNTAYPAQGGDYEDGADPRVQEIDKTTAAYLERATARMVVPMIPERFSEEELRSTLIHETQHHADRHAKGARWAETFGKGEKKAVRKQTRLSADTLLEAMGSFRSEFRAYFVERLFSGRLEGAALDDKGLHDLAERLAGDAGADIKRHIAGEYPYAEELLKVDFFRSAIEELVIPTGGNLLNSVRVEELVASVEAHGGQRGLRKTKAPLDRWEAIIRSMHPLELQFLLEGRFCREFWASMESGGNKVPDQIRDMLATALAEAR